jgi:hypothetical protein
MVVTDIDRYCRLLRHGINNDSKNVLWRRSQVQALFRVFVGRFDEVLRLPLHGPLLRRHVPGGRRHDLHGGHGHQVGTQTSGPFI